MYSDNMIDMKIWTLNIMSCLAIQSLMFGTFSCFHFQALWRSVSPKKGDMILLSISLLNIDRFSQFFHRHTQLEICYKIINKDPLGCVATLPCEMFKKTEKLAIIWIKYLV